MDEVRNEKKKSILQKNFPKNKKLAVFWRIYKQKKGRELEYRNQNCVKWAMHILLLLLQKFIGFHRTSFIARNNKKKKEIMKRTEV